LGSEGAQASPAPVLEHQKIIGSDTNQEVLHVSGDVAAGSESAEEGESLPHHLSGVSVVGDRGALFRLRQDAVPRLPAVGTGTVTT
jgi:hypothetical protein